MEHDFSIGCSNDLILLCGKERHSCSDVVCWYGGTVGRQNIHELGLSLRLLVKSQVGAYFQFAVRHGKIQEEVTHKLNHMNYAENAAAHRMDSLRFLDQLLQPGRNTARFVLTDQHHRIVSIVPTNIFVWDYRDKICIVDVDRTISSSTIPAFLATVYLQNYTVCHPGVCQFLSQLVERAPCRLRLLYLTARPIAMAEPTRTFLAEAQHDGFGLPEGPLIGFTGTLAGVLKMEMDASVRIHKYKALKLCLLRPYNDIGCTDPARFLWGGIGNCIADELAYRDAGVPTCRILIIGARSTIRRCQEGCICLPRRTALCQEVLKGFAGYHDAALLQYLFD
ncbi:phosphatidate phosphatase LPIN [Fistulifera solaris]|uniref:Phosphatidate phosphatase LPIN n=1 Tax=Fistulifera solaris TaxID=1519565 RepID=A0A1Z5K424_FISSO|nr:phosphatidate phosphatase LPIN [Fistulifera solaris]|eukprot:GAX20975.1 phosphatidate phosphatase LPIN [Fistulifera solaris]